MNFEQKVCSTIKRIPPGKVATYGQIAALAGSPRSARAVGTILRYSAEYLPWQRVVNKEGRISIVNMEFPAEVQAELLRQEGVEVNKVNGDYMVNLGRFLWKT